MQNTTHYNLKKPDYTDFADIQDINDNMDTIDEELAAPTGDGRDQTVSFTDADLDSGITSFPNFLTKIVSGMKLAKFLRDFKAGMAYVLHVGDLINNATCTESGKALDARMGKTLQDQITSLNDSLESKYVDITRLERFAISLNATIQPGENSYNFTFGSPLSGVPSRIFCGMPQTWAQYISAYNLTKNGGIIRLYNAGDQFTATNMIIIGIALFP